MREMESAILIGNIATSQLGDIWVATSERGLIAVEFGVPRSKFERTVRSLTGSSTQLLPAQKADIIAQATCEIVEYLRGKRRKFAIPIDWSILGSEFRRTALRAVEAIPYGETRTYGQIATEIGYAHAPRAVGRANATNPMPLVIPCHRVIGSDGKLHGYGGAGGLKTKQWLLDLERTT